MGRSTLALSGVLLGSALLLWAAEGLSSSAAVGAPTGTSQAFTLQASTLTPAPGGSVSLEYSGEVDSLKLRWVGADPLLGRRLARLEVPADANPGEPLTLRLEADGQAPLLLELRVQGAEDEGPLPSPELALRALPWVSGECLDGRAGRLAGEWAVGCGAGRVDRAEQLRGREQLRLESAVEMPAVASGLLYAMGRELGVWRLPELTPSAAGPFLPDPLIAPPATDGRSVALSTRGAVHVAALDSAQRQRIPASPAPWYPPAVTGSFVAWVDVGERRVSGEDVWLWSPEAAQAVALVRREGHQRHVAASSSWVAWIEDEAVVVQDLRRPERRAFPADAHTSRGLSLWGPVACWEQWSGADVDVACSDGLALTRPGDQRNPSRYGPYLLFREGQQVLLATASWVLLDDDDPRAEPRGLRVPDAAALRGARVEGGVVYRVELPEGPYWVERRGPEGWERGERVEGGQQAIEAPWGDAVRLVPAW